MVNSLVYRRDKKFKEKKNVGFAIIVATERRAIGSKLAVMRRVSRVVH